MAFRLAFGDPFLNAFWVGTGAAFSLFLTWAIGREIDPDNDWAAFIAGPFVLVAFVYLGPPSFLALLFILLSFRVLNGTTGLKATIPDALLLLGLASLLFFNGIVTAMPILAAIFFFDAVLEPINRRYWYFAAITLTLFAGFLLIFRGITANYVYFSAYPFTAALLLVASAVVLLKQEVIKQRHDDLGVPLKNRRVCLAQLLIAGFIFCELLLRGEQALVSLNPVLLTYFSLSAYRLVRSTGQVFKPYFS